ncbi:MAG: four helix bundle protein [Ignavibacteria bacterium]
MGEREKFEDIESWRKARKLVGDLYRVTGRFSKDYSLRDQIRRAGMSIMLNIAGGFGRQPDREFAQFLFIALASVAEIQSALYVALDHKYVEETSFRNLYNQCSEVARLISGFIKYLRKT